MSLEQALNENTAAMRDLIAALGGAAGKTAAAGKGAADDAADKPTTTRRRSAANKDAEEKTKASKYSAEDVKAAAVKVKEELGTKAAKQLIKDHGADELAALKPEKYDAFVDACEKALNGDDDGEGEEDGL